MSSPASVNAGEGFHGGGRGRQMQQTCLLTFPSRQAEYCGFRCPHQPDISTCVSTGYPWQLVGCPPLSAGCDAGDKEHSEPVCIRKPRARLTALSMQPEGQEGSLGSAKTPRDNRSCLALLLSTVAGPAQSAPAGSPLLCLCTLPASEDPLYLCGF